MLLIRNTTLIDMAGRFKERADVLIDGGRFAKIGQYLEKKEGYEIIDAAGRLVTPGFIESHSHMGLMDSAGQDINEKTGPIRPALRALDAIDFHSPDFDAALSHGVTTLAIGPGSSNLIGGTFAAVKSGGDSIAKRIVKEELCMKMALGENPKGNYGPQGKMPGTRMGSAALIRTALYKARDYREKWIRHQEKLKNGEESSFTFDLELHSLMRVFDGLPVKIHVHQMNDIMTAIRIGREFQLRFTLEHCTEGHRMAEELREAGAMPIIGPVVGGKGKLELAGKRFDAAAMLEQAGIPFAITTDFPVIPMEGLLLQAAVLIKNGLSEEGAYRGLTVNAAKAMGLWEEIGSIEAGKQADLVIWDQEPFHTAAKAGIVIIDGKVRYWAA